MKRLGSLLWRESRIVVTIAREPVTITTILTICNFSYIYLLRIITPNPPMSLNI